MLEIIANAKVNLFLEITGRRADGYHTVDTVMQEVAVSDTISLQLLPKNEGIRIKSNIDSIPTDARNIAYKAAKRFIDRAQVDCGFEIYLTKNIPHEAGMGGGSADGAAALKAMNELCGNPLDREGLHEIAATMGADVPFFIYGGTALMSGIGTEFVSSLATPELDLVIVKPTVGISTPAAYGYLDNLYDNFRDHIPQKSESLIDALKGADSACISKCLFNRFEEAADELCPQVKALRTFMRDNSYASLLSGSGSAVFAVAESPAHANRIRDLILRQFPDYYVCVSKTI